MRRIALWFATTVTLVVLLFAYHTSTDRGGAVGTQGTGVPGLPSGEPTPARGRVHHRHPSSSSHSRHSHHHSSAGKTAATKTAATKTYTGPVVQTARGPVEVRVRVRSGKITSVNVPVHPSGDPRSLQINDYAVPLLVHETVSAQSSHIDMVSGATITSEGYLQSLQSALDKAGI